jgi:hypothetical protein
VDFALRERKQSVEVTLRLAVRQSVCLGVHDQIFILAWKLLFYPYGAPPLTRGRVCHLSVMVSSIKSIVTIYVVS